MTNTYCKSLKIKIKNKNKNITALFNMNKNIYENGK
jgi:hypothetical protein